MSNFLLWQAAYSELIFVPTYWPDFDRAALESAIREYQQRERRFGGLVAQTGILNPVVDADPVSNSGGAGKPLSASNLALRVLSAVVLAPLALFTAYLGGWPFALFWGAAALAVLWEWITLVVGPAYRLMFSSCGAALVIAGFVAWLGRPVAALLMVGLGALAAAVFAPPERRLWVTHWCGIWRRRCCWPRCFCALTAPMVLS